MAMMTDWPTVLREVSERWKLTVGPPFEPGAIAALVAPARTPSGEDVVLKLGWWQAEGLHEADALRLWDGAGAVRLVDSYDTCVLMLERCSPGTSLGASLPEPEQDVIVAGLLRRLGKPPPDGHPFRPLSEMCDQWAEEFDKAPAVLDPGIAREGIALFRSLPRTATESVLLCTDLHAGNVLAAQREPWLVIDPKPYVGDPAYDVLQHMLNCEERLATDPAGLAARMAGLAGLDAERVRLWLFARCVQQSPGWPELRGVATRLAY